MKPHFLFALVATASISQAGTPANVISMPEPASPWSFGAGYAPLIGLKTEFSGLGTFNRTFPEQPLGGGQNYNYDNGFVRIDSSGNVGGTTWNWGYDDASQFDPAGGGSIAYSLSNSVADARATESGENASGLEAFTYFDMGTATIPYLKDMGATWGFRGGIHYARVDIGNSAALSSSTFVLTDRFNLGGVAPPPAPYSGSFVGPGPLISDSPVRSITPGAAAVVAGARELDVHLTTMSFGSYLEIPVCPHFSVLFEGGVNAAIASGEYDFTSATTIAGVGTVNSAGSDSSTDILPGIYLGLSGIYQINDNWALQASGRFQYLDDFTLGDNGSHAELSFGSTFLLSVGAIYTF
jgi:hypothetical protein